MRGETGRHAIALSRVANDEFPGLNDIKARLFGRQLFRIPGPFNERLGNAVAKSEMFGGSGF